jgi:predicted HD phosphohydrolase
MLHSRLLRGVFESLAVHTSIANHRHSGVLLAVRRTVSRLQQIHLGRVLLQSKRIRCHCSGAHYTNRLSAHYVHNIYSQVDTKVKHYVINLIAKEFTDHAVERVKMEIGTCMNSQRSTQAGSYARAQTTSVVASYACRQSIYVSSSLHVDARTTRAVRVSRL